MSHRGHRGPAVLTINSRNYGAWSLRGWLLCKLAGLDFTEKVLPSDDPDSRAELMLLSPSFLVPKLEHGDVEVWGALAIAEYLAETCPDAGLLPADPAARARCRSISNEMHNGFVNLRTALPMNVRARFDGFQRWSGAQAEIDRIVDIWVRCLDDSGGPFLFGPPTMADAMFAPVCSRFVTYHVELDDDCQAYVDTVMAWEPVVEWVAAAETEPDDLDDLGDLDMEF